MRPGHLAFPDGSPLVQGRIHSVSRVADFTRIPAGAHGVVTPWTTGRVYIVGQPITNAGKQYIALTAHTAAAAFATDAANWLETGPTDAWLECDTGTVTHDQPPSGVANGSVSIASAASNGAILRLRTIQTFSLTEFHRIDFTIEGWISGQNSTGVSDIYFALEPDAGNTAGCQVNQTQNATVATLRMAGGSNPTKAMWHAMRGLDGAQTRNYTISLYPHIERMYFLSDGEEHGFLDNASLALGTIRPHLRHVSTSAAAVSTRIRQVKLEFWRS